MGRLDRFMKWMNGGELRADWGTKGTTVPLRPTGFSISGSLVDRGSTIGLATAGAALHLVTETVGLTPMKVYQGEKPNVSEARDSWQWFRLKEQPNDDQTAFDFWCDAATSIETMGDAFIWKVLGRRPVQGAEDIQLYLLDPDRVQVKRDEDGRRYYLIRRGAERERVPASQILHIRGWSPNPGDDRGLSTIAQYRDTIGAALSAQEYASRMYSNGLSIPGWITTPGMPDQDSIDDMRETVRKRHSGLENAHVPGVLTNGAGWIPSGISMKDAQYIETQQFSAEEVARVFRVTPQMLGIKIEQGVDYNAVRDQFLTVDMSPRYRRIEMSVGRDPDLFPAGTEMFPEFLTAAVLRPSLTTRMSAYVDAIQAGVFVQNEARELENLPPKEGGDELQQTPVGGAPNPPGSSEEVDA